MNPSRMLASLVCLGMFCELLSAQGPTELWRNWTNVSTLRTGQIVAIETFQPQRKPKGTFLASNEANITIRTKDGEQTIPKENVFKLTKRRSIAPPLLVGAVAGAVIYAIATRGGEFTSSGHFALGAAFAGIGTLAGLGVGSIGRSKLIYQAPVR